MEYDLHLSGHAMARALGKKRDASTSALSARRARRLACLLVRRSARHQSTKGLRGDLYRKFVKRALQKQREEEERQQRKKEEEERKRKEAEIQKEGKDSFGRLFFTSRIHPRSCPISILYPTTNLISIMF